MTVLGFLLLLSGWLLALAALLLLHAGWSRNIFVGAGVAVEALGLVLAARAHKALRADRG